MAPRDIDPSLTRIGTGQHDFTVQGHIASIALKGERADSSTPYIEDVDTNVAETYGIHWDIEKCGRDVYQNFFDAHGGTLDGVSSVKFYDTHEDGSRTYGLNISGNTPYDFRDLTIIGATTKRTGGHTAGGFGEGAKFLALSLLRDHNVDQIIFRAADWQLEFFIGDMPEQRVARPTRGLYARVAQGLPHLEGSTLTITSKDETAIDQIDNTRRLFRSSENPDFQDVTVSTTLDDGTEIGLKFVGFDKDTATQDKPKFQKGRLYVAGQCRRYNDPSYKSLVAETNDPWETLAGMSAYTTRDISSGDRDRGTIEPTAVIEHIYKALASNLNPEKLSQFFRAIEPAYGMLDKYSSMQLVTNLMIDAARKQKLLLDFDEKYVAVTCSDKDKASVILLITAAGKIPCFGSLKDIGMGDDALFLAQLHKHTEIHPTPEQTKRIGMLEEAIDYLASKTIAISFGKKPLKLYSQSDERSPAHGTYDHGTVWLALEHLNVATFVNALTTVLHENTHHAGPDTSAEFSYALTDTLAAVLNVALTDPDFHQKLQELNQRWEESIEKSSTRIALPTNTPTIAKAPWRPGIPQDSLYNTLRNRSNKGFPIPPIASYPIIIDPSNWERLIGRTGKLN